jgi:competence protein ComGC
MVPVKGQTGLAFLVVLAIAGVALLIIIVSAFSQDNDRASITGNTATTTQHQIDE